MDNMTSLRGADKGCNAQSLFWTTRHRSAAKLRKAHRPYE